MIQPPFLVSISSCPGCCAVLFFLDSGFCSGCWLIQCNEGIKPPFNWQQGSLLVWVGVLCIREGDTSLSLLLTWKGTYLLHPPCLVLLTMTQFHEWLHQSWGSLFAGIYGQQCHSLGQKYVFPPTSTGTSYYLRLHPSSVDALVDIHGRSLNFLLIHPREVLLAGLWVTALPPLSCGVIVISLPLEVGLHGVGLVNLSHAWWMPILKEMPTSDVTRRSQFQWRMHDLLHWSVTF